MAAAAAAEKKVTENMSRVVRSHIQWKMTNGKQQTYYKVIVQQLNFIERGISSVSLYNENSNSMTPESKIVMLQVLLVPLRNSGNPFFANPIEWWDNRKNKRSPNYPDFKLKDTREPLWVEDKYNPWVRWQLAILDSRMESFHEQNSSMRVNFMAADNLGSF